MKHWNKAVESASPAYWFRKVKGTWHVVPQMGDEEILQVLVQWKRQSNGKYKKSLLLDMDDKFRILFAPTIEKGVKSFKLPKVTPYQKELAKKKNFVPTPPTKKKG